MDHIAGPVFERMQNEGGAAPVQSQETTDPRGAQAVAQLIGHMRQICKSLGSTPSTT